MATLTIADLERIQDQLADTSERNKRAREYLDRKQAESYERGLTLARNIAGAALVIGVTVWLAIVASKAFGQMAHDTHRADTFSALYEGGF